MGAQQSLRKILVFVVAMAVVSSVAAAPVVADDDVTIDSDGVSVGDDVDAGTDGVSVGDDDGVSVSAGDDTDVSVGGSADEDGVDAEADGSAGDSSGGVDCEVSTSTSDDPCETSSDDGGSGDDGSPTDDVSTDQLPEVSGSIPADPSTVGASGVGVTEPVVEQDGESVSVYTGYRAYEGGYGTSSPVMVDAGPEGISVVQYPSARTPNGTYRGTDDVSADTEDGTVELSTVRHAAGRTAGTTVDCDASAGWLRLCGLKNQAPAGTSAVPQENLPELPEDAPVSYGLLFLVADTAVQEPTAIVNLGIGTAAGETPEESPVNPGRPPYNPNDPPVDPTDQSTIDPDASASPGSMDGDVRSGSARAQLNDRIYVDGYMLTLQGSDGIDYGYGSVRASDGQNSYTGSAQTDGENVTVRKGGFVFGEATVGPNDQSGSGGVALGGQPYSQEFGGSESSGSFPAAGQLPDDPSVPV